MDQQPHSSHAPGLIAGLAGIVKNLFGLFVSRIELAALELAEIRAGLTKLLVAFAVGIVALWFAIAYWSGLVVVLAWESMGWKILLVLATLFTLMGIGVLLYARALLNQGKLSMPATMAELRKDRDALL
jgi:uncharacterized membrane protein YqjE